MTVSNVESSVAIAIGIALGLRIYKTVSYYLRQWDAYCERRLRDWFDSHPGKSLISKT